MLGERRNVGAPGEEDRVAQTLTSFPTPRQARLLHALPQFHSSEGGQAQSAVRPTRQQRVVSNASRASEEHKDGPGSRFDALAS